MMLSHLTYQYAHETAKASKFLREKVHEVNGIKVSVFSYNLICDAILQSETAKEFRGLSYIHNRSLRPNQI